MHRLLYAWPVNKECDVREEIVNWMVTTLVFIQGIALFRHTVDEKVKACVWAKMQSVGQTTIPDIHKPLSIAEKTKNRKGKTKQTRKNRPRYQSNQNL
jgi:hypothetical protein